MKEVIKESGPQFSITEEMVMLDESLKDAYWEERIAASRIYGPQWAIANFSTDGKVISYIIDGEIAGFVSENSAGKVDIKGRLNSRGNRNRLTSTPFTNFEIAKKVLAKYLGASD